MCMREEVGVEWIPFHTHILQKHKSGLINKRQTIATFVSFFNVTICEACVYVLCPIKSGVKNLTTIKKTPGNCVEDSDVWHALLSEHCSQPEPVSCMVTSTCLLKTVVWALIDIRSSNN